MTPRQWFALVLRYLGAYNAVSATTYLTAAYNINKGLYSPGFTPLGAINRAVVDVVVAAVLLFFADRIAAYFVPARRPGAPATNDGDQVAEGNTAARAESPPVS